MVTAEFLGLPRKGSTRGRMSVSHSSNSFPFFFLVTQEKMSVREVSIGKSLKLMKTGHRKMAGLKRKVDPVQAHFSVGNRESGGLLSQF
jgi:hypothetical protein